MREGAIQTSDDHGIFLSIAPATRRDRAAALAVVGLSSFLFACAVPFAGVPLAPVPAFVASYQSALAINDLITAILLYSQFGILRSRALLLLASGYLFTAAAATVHALTFPGLFAPSGLFNAGSQTTVWLYMIWHGGFPLLVLGYALLKDREGGVKIAGSAGTAILASVVAVVVTISALAWVATAKHDILPTLLSGGHYTSTMIGVVSTVWCLSLGALLVLWFRRPHSVLDVWLMVVLCAWLFDIALSAIVNVARFDLGFYAGRIYGLCAASFVLAVLLIDNVALQEGLSRPARNVCAGRLPPTGTITRRARACSARWWNSSNDAIITKTLDGTITGWNRAAERLFGFTAAEAVGKHIEIIVPPDKHAEVRDILRRIGKGEAIEHHETLRHPQGRPAGRCFAGHLTDPVGDRRNRRRIQDRARHRRGQADETGAQPGDRGAATHLRDLAGPHSGDGCRGDFRPGQPEFHDHPGLRPRGNDRAQRGRIHPSR